MVSLRSLLLPLCLSVLGCSGFKSEPPYDLGPRDRGTPELGPREQGPREEGGGPLDLGPMKDLQKPEPDRALAFGPGPWGALPTGYCCTSDDQCRFRSCKEFDGTKMCSDECTHAGGCQGNLSGFTCVGTPIGHCEPVDPGQIPACIPANSYSRGIKTLGQCCSATHDGTAGLECEGGRCSAFGAMSNPFFCTHVCTQFSECPSPYTCSTVGDYSICVNFAESYMCE